MTLWPLFWDGIPPLNSEHAIRSRRPSQNNKKKSYSVNPFRHRLKKRSYLFRYSIEVQYKSCMMESDAQDIFKFTKNDPKNLSGDGKMLLQIMKSYLELYHELKSTIRMTEDRKSVILIVAQ